eukprot:510185_1
MDDALAFQHEDSRLLATIFSKILKNPDNLKYQNLNVKTIGNRFKNKKSGLQLLLYVGFKASGSTGHMRLIFDMNDINMNKLMAVNERFVAYISRKDDTNAIDENMSDMTEEKTDEPTAISYVFCKYQISTSVCCSI